MARFCTLASGSSGNSTYISTVGGGILIDAGISFKSLSNSILSVGGDVSKLCAVAITHTHTDHIKGLKTLLSKTRIPLIASSQTLECLRRQNVIPSENDVICVENGIVEIGDIGLEFFSTSHDAEGSGGYVIIQNDGRRSAVCTDLGVVTDTVRKKLCGCDTVLIESNHDVEMLKCGPYPPQLKLRILSENGHLSNNACATELPSLLQNGTKRIILGHLSAENNTPILAASAARAALSAIGAKEDIDYILKIAKPKTPEVILF